MKQIEITVRLDEDIKSAIEKLEKQGFKKIRESNIDDIYMTNLDEEICEEKIQEFLKNAVLLRKLELENEVIKKLTYKNKEFNSEGDVISEQKVNVGCDDLEKAKRLFECLKFKELVEVKYHVIVYKKDNKEFAFQQVDNLGTLIEYENEEDFSEKSIEEINSTKEKMYQEILATNIKITDELDVKKAYELIRNRL
ncbi:MAG: hypothetical protein IJ220_07945 [Clostridia bacterium]|nr:hypothetical protein [Clostridia bacterium]